MNNKLVISRQMRKYFYIISVKNGPSLLSKPNQVQGELLKAEEKGDISRKCHLSADWEQPCSLQSVLLFKGGLSLKPITSSCSAHLSIIPASGLPPGTLQGLRDQCDQGCTSQVVAAEISNVFHPIPTNYCPFFFFFVRALIQMCQANKKCIS